jgi:creatinase
MTCDGRWQRMMSMRAIKSAEELDVLRASARFAAQAAAVGLIAPGVVELDIATAASSAMHRAIAATLPSAGITGCKALFQSGIHTDGAHNPETDKRIASGEVLSLTCDPMPFSYASTLRRTLFCGQVDEASPCIRQGNLKAHRRALNQIRHGALCSDIASALSDLDREDDVLKYRTGGYGQQIGLKSNSLGGDFEVEIREDCFAKLRSGMVISVDPMLMVPDGEPGAGGYRDTDVMIITEAGAERITDFPLGPDHNIIPARHSKKAGRMQSRMGR